MFTIIHLCSHGCFFCVCSPLFFLCFSVCVFLFSSCRLVFISFIPPFYVFVCFVSFFLVLSVSVSVWFLSAFFNYIIQKNNNLLFTCLLACVCVCVCVCCFHSILLSSFPATNFFFSHIYREKERLPSSLSYSLSFNKPPRLLVSELFLLVTTTTTPTPCARFRLSSLCLASLSVYQRLIK